LSKSIVNSTEGISIVILASAECIVIWAEGHAKSQFVQFIMCRMLHKKHLRLQYLLRYCTVHYSGKNRLVEGRTLWGKPELSQYKPM